MISFFLLALPARAQFATVQGRVVEAAGERPLPGATVVLVDEEGTRRGTATAADGTFTLAQLPPGTYVLTASSVGYTPHADTLALDFGQRLTRTIRLSAVEAALDEVVVESEQAGAAGGRPLAGFEQVRPAALTRVPMPDVSSDLMAYLLTMPGVVTAGDRGGQLFIRGGEPTQNLVMVDGMRIYQPFHIVGFYSIFPADLLAHADLYTGGFGARYGGRISSVIDVSMRNGSKERVQGAVSVAPFLSAVRVEGPVVPGKVSFLASARESIIERIAPLVLDRELPYRFGDVYLKTHAYLSRTSSFSATALHTYDQGDVAATGGDVQTSRWKNQAVGLRYTYLPAESPVMTQLAVYTSRFDSRYRPSLGQERRAGVSSIASDILFAYLLGAQQIHLGIFAYNLGFRYNLTGTGLDTEGNVTEGGVYVDGRFRLGDLGVEPGLRLQAYSHDVGAAWEPRLRLVWQPGGPQGRQAFSVAAGVYHQQVIGLHNQRDVTDAFVAWAPSPPQTPVPRALHVAAGWQRKLGPWLDASVEGYYKEMDNLFFPDLADELDDVVDVERVAGRARGVELRLEASRAWFYGYAGYGLGLVQYERQVQRFEGERTPDGEVIPRVVTVTERFSPPQDRRHQLNVLAQVARGPYRLGLRWQFGSGLPFTQLQGYYEALTVTIPGDDRYHTRPGETRISYGPPYGARLPAYHRFDVSFDRRFEGRRWTATLQASLINVYDRANIFSYDLLTHRRVDQLPLLPTVGLKVELH